MGLLIGLEGLIIMILSTRYEWQNKEILLTLTNVIGLH